MKKLILLRGLPGSGKSTLAKALGSASSGHYEADMYFVNEKGEYYFDATKIRDAHQWCQDEVEKGMGPHGFDEIFVTNTFTQEWEMEPYYELAKRYGYTVFSLVVENRHNGVNVHGAPLDTIERMRNRFKIKL